MRTRAATAWQTQSIEVTARQLEVEIGRGLGQAEAMARLALEGPNTLTEAKPRSALKILAHQFASIMVGLLITAACLAFALRNTIEGIAIGIVIALNAFIGFATEWQAARALAALKRQEITTARVLRDGQEHQLPAADLVPGDIVLLAAGDRVPADGRVVDQVRLQVDEATLTGESVPTTKSSDPVTDAHVPLADQTSMVHMGTAIVHGRCTIVVTTTGARTELGKIGTLIHTVEKNESPLEKKLSQLSGVLLVVVLGLCGIIVLVGWLRGNELFHMAEVGISLAISAVPEGLLAVTTMTLAIGMQRMARMHALVRRLPAVEALGAVTVICSDKTGTLTRNEMTVRAFSIAEHRYEVSGEGYTSEGRFSKNGQPIDPRKSDREMVPLRMALRICALCNDAQLEHAKDHTRVLGDPTEGALLVVAAKAGLDRAALEEDAPRIQELTFSSDTKRMVTVHRAPGARAIAYVKGAPATVLDASTQFLGIDGVATISTAQRAAVLRDNDALAATALRILGLAYRELPEDHTDVDLTRDLTFVGLVGMIDPLRAEAKRTIAVCRKAGIRTVMITGDQQATATEIARQLGLDRAPDGRPLRTIHARELLGLDAEGWRQIVDGASVFARVSPMHKLQIVDAFQRQGHIVAMTGDGVNDAPALRKADIGIAMGIRGTEVAKDASDMIITDDDFATIVSAVEQGRIVAHNLLRFIHFLFSTNFSEIVTVFAAIVIGWPLPLTVLQILWLNLATDVFPAMALALEPSAPNVMTNAPRDPHEPLITPRFGVLIAWQGTLLAACALATFAIGQRWYGVTGVGLAHAATIAFMTLAFAQLFHAFNARSQRRSAFSADAFSNRWLWGATVVCVALHLSAILIAPLRTVLGAVPLLGTDWALVAAGALSPVGIVELVKLAQRGCRATTTRRAARLTNMAPLVSL